MARGGRSGRNGTHSRLLLVAEPAAVQDAVEDVEHARRLAVVRVLHRERDVVDGGELGEPRDARRERVQLVLGEGRALDVVAGGSTERADGRLLELAELGLIGRRQVLGGEEGDERADRLVEKVGLRVLEELLGDVVPERLVRLRTRFGEESAR